MTSDLNILCCPKCGGVHLAVSVETWADFVGGSPDHFDEEDIHSVIPLEGHPAICRSCQHQWTIAGRFTQTIRSLTEYAFDIKLWAVCRVKANSEKEARAKMRDHVDCLDISYERDGVKLTEASAEGDGDLIEVDGEAV